MSLGHTTIFTEEEVLNKYSADDLIMEAETLEMYGENLHIDLVGYTAEHLRKVAKKRINSFQKDFPLREVLFCSLI